MTGVVVWFTGLPSSGKSTLAQAVREQLRERGKLPCVLDGDVMRAIIAPSVGYSEPERAQFYSALARLAGELAAQGFVVLVPATAHLREYRELARALSARFLEVWVTTALAECQQRDSKGLYASAASAASAASSPSQLPGIDLTYETPQHAEVLATGGDDRQALERIVSLVG